MLLFDATPQALVALLAVVKAGAVYVPIRPSDPRARLLALVAAAAPARILADAGLEHELAVDLEPRPLWIERPESAPSSASEQVLVPRTADDVLYVMYTSGTTNVPKGVVVEQAGVLRLIDDDIVDWSEGDRVLLTGSLAFDASTFEIWVALVRGATLCLPDPGSLLEPAQLRRELSDWSVGSMWLTAPLFHRLAHVDVALFRGLRHLLVGGSVVSPQAVAQVVAANPELRVTNGYGPTESTTFTTTYAIEGSWSERLPIGRPVAGTELEVVGIDGAPVPLGVSGELFIAGRGLARGYLRAPELTAAAFVPHAGRRHYASGDVVRWRPDGLLEYIGRMDGQIKIRGFRVQPEDVEQCIAAQAGVHDASVVVHRLDANHEVELHAYYTGPCDPVQLRRELGQQLPSYMLPARLHHLDVMPYGATGKIDRRALADAGGSTLELPSDPLERAVASLMARVLELDALGRDDDFFEHGGHSMKAIELIALIHKELGVKLGLQRVLGSADVASLAQAIRETDPSPHDSIGPAPAAERDPLSVSQRRIAALFTDDPDNTAFNISHRSRVDAPFDEPLVRRAFALLVERHGALRTRLERHDGEWWQRVDGRLGPALSVAERGMSSAEVERLSERHAARVLDLEHGPPHHVIVVPDAQGFEVLWLVHHLVADGWSMHLLQRDLCELYGCVLDDRPPPPAPLQLRDYVVWHNGLLARSETAELGQRFWQTTLRGAQRLQIREARVTGQQTQIGLQSAGYRCSLSSELSASLRRLARSRKTSLFAVLLAGYVQLLHELSGQTDVLTAIPSANRANHELEQVVGFLVDSVLVRVSVVPGEPFTALLERTSNRVMRALDHAYYPIELACATVDTRWEDLLSNFFNLSTFGDTNKHSMPDPGPRHLDEVQTAKMPLILYLSEHSDGVSIEVNYYTELFAPATIERFMLRYSAIMSEAV